MSAYNAAGYLSLLGSRDVHEGKLLKIQADLSEVRARLQSDQSALSSWQNAGNSDMANKLAQIAVWTNAVQQRQNEIAKLEADEKIEQNKVAFYEAQMQAFVTNYNEAIVNGKSPDQAASEAGSIATKHPDDLPFYRKTWGVALIVVAAIAATYFLLKKRK